MSEKIPVESKILLAAAAVTALWMLLKYIDIL